MTHKLCFVIEAHIPPLFASLLSIRLSLFAYLLAYVNHGYPPDQIALGITGAIAAMFFNPLMMGLAGAILSDIAFEKDEHKLDGASGQAMFFILSSTFGGLYWGLKYIVIMWGNPWMAMMWSSICNIFWLTSILLCVALVQPRKVWAPITVLGGFVLNGIVVVVWLCFILLPPEW
jgi:hypothetical protein